jgi:hypothetical protein
VQSFTTQKILSEGLYNTENLGARLYNTENLGARLYNPENPKCGNLQHRKS